MKFKIYRYNPEKDKKPYVQEYQLENVEPGTMLLTALLRIKDEQDETLSFRRSCGEGVCGSDGMNINGVNGCWNHLWCALFKLCNQRCDRMEANYSNALTDHIY